MLGAGDWETVTPEDLGKRLSGRPTKAILLGLLSPLFSELLGVELGSQGKARKRDGGYEGHRGP